MLQRVSQQPLLPDLVVWAESLQRRTEFVGRSSIEEPGDADAAVVQEVSAFGVREKIGHVTANQISDLALDERRVVIFGR